MKLNGIISVLLLSTVIVACKSEQKKEEEAREGFVIEGKIENGRGTVIRLAKVGLQNADIVATDTADINGEFKLTGFSREKFVAVFNFDETKKIFLVVDTQSRINLQIPAVSYDNYTVRGSEESQELRTLRDIEVRSGKEITDLRMQGGATTSDQELEKIQAKLQAVYDKYNEEYVQELRKSRSPLIQLFFYYNLQLNYDDNMKKLVHDNAVASGLKSDFVQKFIRDYQNEQITAVGKVAPEITLPDTSGTPVSLSSLKGKVVLIDFWASWCGPCRQENPNVVQTYRKYKDKGFEIFGVSLDDNGGKWRSAIAEDGIFWTHVSDLQGWSSSAARLYAVTGIPATFLIDREGKIVAKNLRGKKLEEKVAEILR